MTRQPVATHGLHLSPTRAAFHHNPCMPDCHVLENFDGRPCNEHGLSSLVCKYEHEQTNNRITVIQLGKLKMAALSFMDYTQPFHICMTRQT